MVWPQECTLLSAARWRPARWLSTSEHLPYMPDDLNAIPRTHSKGENGPTHCLLTATRLWHAQSVHIHTHHIIQHTQTHTPYTPHIMHTYNSHTHTPPTPTYTYTIHPTHIPHIHTLHSPTMHTPHRRIIYIYNNNE